MGQYKMLRSLLKFFIWHWINFYTIVFTLIFLIEKIIDFKDETIFFTVLYFCEEMDKNTLLVVL